MVNGTLGEHSVLDALSWVGLTSATGSLKVDASTGGTVFFDKGEIYYATVDDRPLRMAELEQAGITQSQWRQASQRPNAKVDFGAELLAIGVPRSRIEQFITSRIVEAVKGLAALETGTFEVLQGRHGFGLTFSVDVKEILEIVGGEREISSRQVADDDTIVFSRTATGNVVLNPVQWSVLASLVSSTDYATMQRLSDANSALSLIEHLEGLGLAKVESHTSPSVPPSPSSWWAPGDDDIDTASTYENSTWADESLDTSVGSFKEIVPNQGVSDQDLPQREHDTRKRDDAHLFDGLDIAPGKAAYEDIARLRAIQYPDVKAGAIRKLIEAVRGL